MISTYDLLHLIHENGGHWTVGWQPRKMNRLSTLRMSERAQQKGGSAPLVHSNPSSAKDTVRWPATMT